MKFYSSLFLILLCLGCQSEKAPLAADKMSNILSDLHMAESYAQLVPKDRGGYMTKNTDTLSLLYNNIYQKYGLDTASFNEALSWYKQRPLEFDKVYENVLEELSIRKEILQDSITEYSDTSAIKIKDTTEVNLDSIKY